MKSGITPNPGEGFFRSRGGRYLRGTIEVNYVPYTAEWQVSGKNSVRYNDVAAYTTYGTDRANAYRLLEDALNLRDIRIYDTVEDADGRERRVLNAKETTLAAQKQQQEFDWEALIRQKLEQAEMDAGMQESVRQENVRFAQLPVDPEERAATNSSLTQGLDEK